jgi:NAD(P)-dependent dehydrogenase (short-subunit alcohol dehydrogenase family)
MELKNRIGIVSGSGRGIGRGIALGLDRKGVNVIIADVGGMMKKSIPSYEFASWEQMKEVAKECESCGVKSLPLRVDVSDREFVEQMVKEVIGKFERIDILVNNAAVVTTRPFLEEEASLDFIFGVNMKGIFLTCKYVATYMIKQGNGKIVNISSAGGRRGFPRNSLYCASKAAVINFTQSTAYELAPYNINVNCLAPGAVHTWMWDKSLNEGVATLYGVKPNEVLDTIVKMTPLGKLMTIEDMAQAVIYLCEADGVTGETLNVSGGLLIF